MGTGIDKRYPVQPGLAGPSLAKVWMLCNGTCLIPVKATQETGWLGMDATRTETRRQNTARLLRARLMIHAGWARRR